MDNVTMIRVISGVLVRGCALYLDSTPEEAHLASVSETKLDNTGDMVRVINTTRNSCLGEQISMADSSLQRLVGLLGKRSLEPG